jgi:hypothetical protein
MGDVTRHAEMELVRLFTTQLPAAERAACTLYTSTEPYVPSDVPSDKLLECVVCAILRPGVGGRA